MQGQIKLLNSGKRTGAHFEITIPFEEIMEIENDSHVQISHFEESQVVRNF